MKPGGGSIKGSAFERTIATRLSLWVSDFKHDDLYWRTSNSGGRATLKNKTSTNAVLAHQAGDIAAMRPEGQLLLSMFIVECKHWASLHMDKLIWGLHTEIADAWVKLGADCKRHRRMPMLIGKQNLKPEIVILSEVGYRALQYGIEGGALPIHATYPQWRMVVIALRDMQVLSFARIRQAAKENRIKIPAERERESLNADDRYSRLASNRPPRRRVQVGVR